MKSKKGKMQKILDKIKFIRLNTEEDKNESDKHLERTSIKKLKSISVRHHHNNINEIFHKQDSKNVILKMKEMINDYPEKYYHQHLKRDLLKTFINLFASLLHIIIIISYISSLNACTDNLTLNECIKKLDINYYYKVYLLCFISGFLISLILVFIIARFVSIFQLPFIILELLVFIILNHNDNVFNNGLFSFKLLLSFSGISFLLLFLFIFFLITLGQRQYFYSIFFFFASVYLRLFSLFYL
jgi:hypothetical protein